MQPDRMTTPILHPFPPIWDDRACVLILGSFPSVASRDTHFYYGHKQNRFWKLMRQFFGEPLATTDEKIACLNRHHIALWDVIFQCEVTGSSDQSIRNVIPNPIRTFQRNNTVVSVRLCFIFHLFVCPFFLCLTYTITSSATLPQDVVRNMRHWQG